MARGQHQSQATTATAADLASQVTPAVKQEPKSERGEERDDALLLHLIRILALYLVVYLSRSASLVMDDLAPLFGASTAQRDAEEDAGKLLDSLLVAWVERETASNQFDGLLPEHRAFLVIKKFFRQQHARVPQLRVLASLLSTYLCELRAPLVLCGSTAMLRSTLEYLLKTGKVLKAVSPALLYPLVNAVDSLSMEQRDCLEALTVLLQWLNDCCCDSSDTILTKFVSRHHHKIIVVTNDEPADGSASARQQSAPRASSASKALEHLQALGICFVETLLCHCDHIFRRDPEFVDSPALLDSETEDEDFSEHSADASPAGSSRKELAGQSQEDQLESASSPPPTDSPLSSAETEDADDECHEAANAPVVAADSRRAGKSAASRSTRKRKKREHKATGAARLKHTSVATPIAPGVTCSAAAAAASASAKIPADIDADESFATVAIAAAAGTLAAVLCVIFT